MGRQRTLKQAKRARRRMDNLTVRQYTRITRKLVDKGVLAEEWLPELDDSDPLMDEEFDGTLDLPRRLRRTAPAARRGSDEGS